MMDPMIRSKNAMLIRRNANTMPDATHYWALQHIFELVSGLTLREILRLAYTFSVQDVYASLFSYRDCQLDLLDGMRYFSSH